jgi:hypothetical protein
MLIDVVAVAGMTTVTVAVTEGTVMLPNRAASQLDRAWGMSVSTDARTSLGTAASIVSKRCSVPVRVAELEPVSLVVVTEFVAEQLTIVSQ